MRNKDLKSWGRYPNVSNTVHQFNSLPELQSLMQDNARLIPYANGRSYGDSALSSDLVHLRPHHYMLDFDSDTGVLICQAGLLLSEIIDAFVPRGWFLKVTPGTKFVSVGGAIASDVHGKNHHLEGAFSESVLSFKLMLPGGDVVQCSKAENTDLFHATCGGMGLTGVILEAKLQLKPISSSKIDQHVIKTKNLASTFKAFEKYADVTYSVAWIDCLAKGDALGRCLLTFGEHAAGGDLEYISGTKLDMPIDLPSFTLNNLTVKTFNTLYYHKMRSDELKNQVGIDPFFYPLDSITNWNRIYGKNGFTQYQFVLPLESSQEGMTKILERITQSGKGSFLAVLKLFGSENKNWLSFPRKGYTLALDFKIEDDLFPLLDDLDDIVVEYGGRIYLAKDGRINKVNFERGYEHVEKFRNLREQYQMNRHLNSLQSTRLGL